METFAKLFGSMLTFVYHCFDRVVILGYMPLMIRPENIVHFFRDRRRRPDGSKEAITKEMLRARSDQYTHWVESYARKNGIPMEWADKVVARDQGKEDYIRPRLREREREGRFGVYHILMGMEVGPSFHISNPKYATKDPTHRIVTSKRSRHTHYCFHILDPVLGPMSMCAGTFLPFHTTFWINGHSFMERELLREKVAFRKDDNAFLAVDDPKRLQAAADRLSAETIQKQLDYWSLAVGPKFSKKERGDVNLNRLYSIQQVEYCWNFIFKRNTPIHRLYERCCDLGMFRLTADKITRIFGFRKDRRIPGKLQSVLEKMDHGHHVLRVYARNAVGRMYEKFSTLLRVEVLGNNLRDFRLGKLMDKNLAGARRELSAAGDRLVGFTAESLDAHVEFPLFQRMALPVPVETGRRAKGADDKAKEKPVAKIAGIKIHDTRMIRLMEVLMHSATRIGGWRSSQIHQAALEAFGLKPDEYTPNQLRYDLRKMRAHGLVEREGKRHAYRLTDKGVKVAAVYVLFHKRVCGPLAGSLFVRKPHADTKPATKLETAYRKADQSIDKIVRLLAA